MTAATERDQIVFVVRPRVAAELLVMDFQVGHGSAELATPAVSSQDLLPQFVALAIVKPDRRAFHHILIYWIC